MKLYELVNEIENFNLEVDEETGEVVNIADLENLQIEKDTKIENIGLLIKNLKAESDAIKEEAKRLTARAKVAENKAESLKRYLADCLGGEKFKTPRVAISYRKSQAVNIIDIQSISDEYKVVEIKPDKTAIKNAIKEGKVVVGAELEERQSIAIK